MNIEKKILEAIFITHTPDFDPAAPNHLESVYYTHQHLISLEEYLKLLNRHRISYPNNWSADGIRPKRKKYKSFHERKSQNPAAAVALPV